MRNKILPLRTAQSAAKRSVNEGIDYAKITMTKGHAECVSRAFYNSRNDKDNYEFVCVTEL